MAGKKCIIHEKTETNSAITNYNIVAKKLGMSYGEFSEFQRKLEAVEKYERIQDFPEDLRYVEKDKKHSCLVPRKDVSTEMISGRYFESLKYTRTQKRLIAAI